MFEDKSFYFDSKDGLFLAIMLLILATIYFVFMRIKNTYEDVNYTKEYLEKIAKSKKGGV